jgi:hypothetical protein
MQIDHHGRTEQSPKLSIRPALKNLPFLRGCGVVIEIATSTRPNHPIGALQFSIYNRFKSALG